MLRFIFIFLLLIFFQCKSINDYAKSRVLDTTDVFTLSVEKNVSGASIKYCVGFFGLQYAEHGKGYGLRSGTFGSYRTGQSKEFYNSGNSFILVNSVHHFPSRINNRNNKFKSFSHSNSIGFIIFDWDGYNFLTQCEVSVGLYYGFRVGLNFAEFSDWFLGWFYIDLLNDDLN
jgi:hypothetical protein